MPWFGDSSTIMTPCVWSRVKVPRWKADWINSCEIIYARSLRDIAYRGYPIEPTPFKWRIFCKKRNRAKRSIRRVKQAFFDRIFTNADTKDMWNRLRVAC